MISIRKYLTSISAVALMLGFFAVVGTGCKDNKSGDAAKLAAGLDTTDLVLQNGDSNTPQSMELKYNFKEGDKFTYRLTSMTEDVQNLQGDTLVSRKISDRRTYILKVEVKEVDKDAIANLDFTFAGINVDSKIDTMIIKYKTGDHLDTSMQKKYLEFLLLDESTFSARVNSMGDVVDIYKTDKMLNKYFSITGLKDTMPANEKQTLQKELAESIVKPLIGQVFRKFPKQSFKLDDKWDDKKPTMGNASVKIENTQKFTVAKIGKFDGNNMMQIDAYLDSKVELNPELKTSQPGLTIKEPVYGGSGKIYYDGTRGLIYKSKTNTTFRSDMSQVGPNKANTKTITWNRTQITKSNTFLELIK